MDLGRREIQDMLYDKAGDEEATTPKIRRVSRLPPTPLSGRPIIPTQTDTPRRGLFGAAPDASRRSEAPK